MLSVGPTALLQSWTGLPAPAAITLALVAIAAALWVTEAIPLFATSFVILFLELAWLRPAMRSGGAQVESARFLAPFFSNVILLFLGGFALSAAFRKYQLDQRIASWVLERTEGHPGRVLGAVIGVAAVLSMWMSNTATAAMMLGLAMPMLSRVPEDDGLRRSLPLGIAFGANFGGLGTPIGTPPNAIAIGAMQSHAPGFATWMALSVPLLLAFLVASWFLLSRMYPTQVRRVSMESNVSGAISRPGRVVVWVTMATALLWLTGGFHGLETGTVALVPVTIFFGTRILSRDDFVRLPWDVLMLAGGGLSLGTAVEVSGLGEIIVSWVPVEALGAWGVGAALAAVSGLMTTFMSNTATANLLVPVVAGMSGVPTQPLLVIVAFSCSCTMVLPVSTPPNAMVFSSGYITTKDLGRPALVLSLAALIVTCTIGPLWWANFGL